MPPAARKNDATKHHGGLSPGPGSPDVFIGGEPAWRAMEDKHDCPYHGKGHVVEKGSKSVLINGLQACRVGDVVVEGSVKDPIVEGCSTVIIGDMAWSAIRPTSIAAYNALWQNRIQTSKPFRVRKKIKTRVH